MKTIVNDWKNFRMADTSNQERIIDAMKGKADISYDYASDPEKYVRQLFQVFFKDKGKGAIIDPFDGGPAGRKVEVVWDGFANEVDKYLGKEAASLVVDLLPETPHDGQNRTGL